MDGESEWKNKGRKMWRNEGGGGGGVIWGAERNQGSEVMPRDQSVFPLTSGHGYISPLYDSSLSDTHMRTHTHTPALSTSIGP